MQRIDPAKVEVERFWSLVDKRGPDECWEWQGHITPCGYGVIGMRAVARNPLRVHRIAYTLAHGEIPEALVVDHLCRNRRCVNVAHLEVVTNEENIRRGHWHPIANAAKTHCKWGHEFTPENTHITTEGHRACRTCARERGRERLEGEKLDRHQTREARLAARRVWLIEHPEASMSNSEANAIKTHCHRGHPFDEENTCMTKSGKRRCRTCNRDLENARRRRKMNLEVVLP